jgi:hypothetical protein
MEATKSNRVYYYENDSSIKLISQNTDGFDNTNLTENNPELELKL